MAQGGRYYGTFSKRGKTKFAAARFGARSARPGAAESESARGAPRGLFTFGGDESSVWGGGVLPSPVAVTVFQARAFVLRALGLVVSHAGVAEALAHHGCVQFDSINVCGRMHDPMLRNRVAGFRDVKLLRFLHDPANGRRPCRRSRPGARPGNAVGKSARGGGRPRDGRIAPVRRSRRKGRGTLGRADVRGRAGERRTCEVQQVIFQLFRRSLAASEASRRETGGAGRCRPARVRRRQSAPVPAGRRTARRTPARPPAARSR
jgi:hypothetical protein